MISSWYIDGAVERTTQMTRTGLSVVSGAKKKRRRRR
jgi:hypothetical protein